MDKLEEEFEPLFDYSRVQPFNVVFVDDDDSLDSPSVGCKRKSQADENDTNANLVQIIDDKEDKKDKEDKEEEDWLPPPPKTIDTTTSTEDSTIREFRLKRQQLESLARSAKDVLRDVEESVKQGLAAAESKRRDLSAALESADAEDSKEKQEKPSRERAKIVVSIQNQQEIKQFRIYMDDKFEKLFKLYADKFKLDREHLVFSFDGDKINPSATPAGLGMEENDIIEVYLKKH